jgi:hypothetical protein
MKSMLSKQLVTMLALSLLALLNGCDQGTEETQSAADAPTVSDKETNQSTYVVDDRNLTQLREDFNAHAGEVRLLFIVGPTCGICLRGMADLSDEFLAASQNDERLFTFVVHVPTLGAEEKHVADAVPLLDGPRVTHYWEDFGFIGRHYEEVLDIGMYAWDVWMVYGPDAHWEGTLPPPPDFWQHQLQPLPKETRLNAETFAAATRTQLDNVGQGSAVAMAERPSISPTHGTVITSVSQPRGVALEQYIRSRGGYLNLKSISIMRMHGVLEAGGESLPLTVETTRPDKIRRTVTTQDKPSIAAGWDGAATFADSLPRGLERDIESQLLALFEFNGSLVDWKDKGHQVSMQGMLKYGDVLAWRLVMESNRGGRREYLIDSHSGDIVRVTFADSGDEKALLVLPGDYREVSGFRLPFSIEYRDGNDKLLGVERFDEITVTTKPFDIADETVTH